MIQFTAQEIAHITGGTLSPVEGIELLTPQNVVTDSREATNGSLYVAKPGEHADGHDFIGAAMTNGATLVLGERQVLDPSGAPYPTVIVPDAVLAMGALASASVQRIRTARSAQGHDFTVVGITGSAGKTTTKDLLAGIFGSVAKTVAPQGSYNGEVGVPLTVFMADESTRFLVIEMGATSIGHISYLAAMVKPDIGVVLGVGTAHAGEFGGVENIAKAKGELAEAIAPEGTVVLNLDDARVAAMRSRAVGRVLGFTALGSPEATADTVRAIDPATNAEGYPEFELQFAMGERFPVSARLIGAHHVTNLLAAASAASAAGVEHSVIVAALNTQSAASRWRMERTERGDGVTIINDAYNANPESMRAALRTLADLGRGRRTWAVLGAMLELGEESIREHAAVGTQVVRLNISKLLVVGQAARPLYISAIQEGSWGSEALFAATVEEAKEILDEQLESGDLVLFKSSNGVGVRFLGDQIALPKQALSGQSIDQQPGVEAPANEGNDQL
ncbi:UDP-N-acetylmuramoyl-tripeptide--D-alanyl-D-alanine ligase [Pseudarthrobacter sp. J1738]|uniref:UDP-N-acetylmuramoyl-tripeptide--D-alanyl-D- alanine ligase n=1 Tax=Pseudarthrobacter sp. J1738 TaxID=3420446 RepID=UPI003D2A13BA